MAAGVLVVIPIETHDARPPTFPRPSLSLFFIREDEFRARPFAAVHSRLLSMNAAGLTSVSFGFDFRHLHSSLSHHIVVVSFLIASK